VDNINIKMNELEIILVDKTDTVVGAAEKLHAHKKALLHRAVSVLVFNKNGEWLLQQRAYDKYHSGGLWSNTCCTHPYEGEETIVAAKRRLKEEMGLTCELNKAFHFIYKVVLDNGITEYEYDHVFIGVADNLPIPNKNEVVNYKYCSQDELEVAFNNNPENLTFWFKEIFFRCVTERLNLKPKNISS